MSHFHHCWYFAAIITAAHKEKKRGGERDGRRIKASTCENRLKPERAVVMTSIEKKAVAPLDPSNVSHQSNPSVSTETLTHELASCYYWS